MVSSVAARPREKPLEAAVSQTKLGPPTLALAGLITSYFYCLPLGRYTLGGIASDFRIYDFTLLLFVAFFAARRRKLIRALTADRAGFPRWAFFLLVLVWASLIITFATSGTPKLLPAMIRAYRFTGCLLIAVFILSIIDTPERWRFLLRVFYINICIQAVLVCGQAFGTIPHLWPDYWTAGFWIGGNRVPVGTLSPHHKQIGIVMLLGIAMTMAYLRSTQRVASKTLLIVPMALMLSAIALAGSRTAMLGLVGYFFGNLWIYRGKAIPTLAFAAMTLMALYTYTPSWLLDPLHSEIDERITDRVERFGMHGLAGDRMGIYTSDIPTALDSNPLLLITGSGFQNVQRAIVNATGAHNNYMQALLELGILGFFVFMRFLFAILRRLSFTASKARAKMELVFAKDVWALFIGILATMMVGETLWAQYSMFTLSGQIMTLIGLACCPLTWNLRREREERLQAQLSEPAQRDRRASGHRAVAAMNASRTS